MTSRATKFERAQYPDTNRVSEATRVRRSTFKDLRASDMDIYEKMVLMELMLFGGTTRTTLQICDGLRIGVGDCDRALKGLYARRFIRRPNSDASGLDVDRHPDLAGLFDPLVDRSCRGVHLRAAGSRPELAGLTPAQQQRRRETGEREAERLASIESPSVFTT